MISLTQHNREALARLHAEAPLSLPRPCGIACPSCGDELADVRGPIVASDAAWSPVECGRCGYHGYRVLEVLS